MKMKIRIGTYPQTRVGDKELIEKLNSIKEKDENGYVFYEGNYYLKEYVEETDALCDFIDDNEPTYSDGTPIVLGKDEWFKVEPVEFRLISLYNDSNTYLVSDKILEGRIFQEYNEDYIYDEDAYNALNILGWLNDIPYKRFIDNNKKLKEGLFNQTLREKDFKLMIPRVNKLSEEEKKPHLMTDYAKIHCGWYDIESNCGQILTTDVSSQIGSDEPVCTIGADGEEIMSEPDFPLGIVFKICFSSTIEDVIANIVTKEYEKEVVLAAVTNDGYALGYASEVLQNDREIVLAALKSDGEALQYVSEELKNDKEIVLAAVKNKGRALKYANTEFRNDKEVVLTAVKNDAGTLKYVSEELQNDKEIVLAAVSEDGEALEYASEELRNDKEIVLTAVTTFGSNLHCASEELQNDKEIVLAAVLESGWALEYASEELRNDKEVVLTAVKNDISALEYVGEELLDDREIILTAMTYHCNVNEDEIKELKNDKKFVLETVKKVGRALAYASEELQNDKEVVLAAVENDGYAFKYASDELKNDKEFVLEAMRYNGRALRYASEELLNDKEVVLAAVTNNGFLLQYASDVLKNDKEVVLTAVENDSAALQFATNELKNDMKFVLETVKNNAGTLKYVSEELKNDRKFILEAVKNNGRALEYASEELRDDREMVEIAINSDPCSLKYCSKEFIDSSDDLVEKILKLTDAFYIIDYLPDKYFRVKEYAMKFAGTDFTFDKLSDELKKDPDIRKAWNINEDNLRYIYYWYHGFYTKKEQKAIIEALENKDYDSFVKIYENNDIGLPATITVYADTGYDSIFLGEIDISKENFLKITDNESEAG